ncbi:MAG: ATP-binding protein [Candidatus Magnetoglobus multicellularis str. Araruama]|uniref:ATP-binding protein n=1 Tax=Candidatus Magnetoglobus multicellularis str. Araruama TaxID=890399 RepID=A0A1V1PAJ9_9BACT|nr:MAG: ATP-binding protein [Candidatus Magnetoglobus multicellularis str. Araruama]
MTYWLVRAKWDQDDKINEFVHKNLWINGYEGEKFFNEVNSIQKDDLLMLADGSYIRYFGKCTQNDEDGTHIKVDKWLEIKPFYLSGKGAYIKTISKIKNTKIKNSIDDAISNALARIQISALEIENFTVFKKANIEFSQGLNIIIGENATGKSHLLRLIYSILKTNNHLSINNSFNKTSFQRKAAQDLTNIFSVEKVGNLVHKSKNDVKESTIKLDFSKYTLKLIFRPKSEVEVAIEALPEKIFEKKAVFIPTKEILSIFPGFTLLYRRREIEFDETYYDLCSALELPLLKNIQSYPDKYDIIKSLEDILNGKIKIENGRFYLETMEKGSLEITIIAEGIRKIAMLSYLISNDSLDKDSILFWDEPESNLNPRLIKKIAKTLLKLSSHGVQLFIATHSLFLLKEIEIIKTKQSNIKYFSLSMREDSIEVIQGNTIEDIDEFVSLDEELEQSERFMDKEHISEVNG